MEEIFAKKRACDAMDEWPELDADIPEVKRLRESLLENLDDDSEFYTTSQDLVLYIKTFEEEIMNSSVAVEPEDLRSDSGESQPELGYLLEASDDDLGIPPTISSHGTIGGRTETESVELWTEFYPELSSFDWFEFERTDDSPDADDCPVG